MPLYLVGWTGWMPLYLVGRNPLHSGILVVQREQNLSKGYLFAKYSIAKREQNPSETYIPGKIPIVKREQNSPQSYIFGNSFIVKRYLVLVFIWKLLAAIQ